MWEDEWNPEMAWASGLFCGEGSCYTNKKGMHISIGMLDHRAIEKWAKIMRSSIPFGERKKIHGKVNVSYSQHIKGGIFARVHSSGKYAMYLATAMVPYIKDTDKGEQIIRNLKLYSERG